MYHALGARQLRKPLNNVFLESANINKIWVRLQGGGIFEKTRRFVIVNDGVNYIGLRGSHTQEEAIK
jgi:hypothetical protein